MLSHTVIASSRGASSLLAELERVSLHVVMLKNASFAFHDTNPIPIKRTNGSIVRLDQY